MAAPTKVPLWMRIMFKIAGKLGYIIVLSTNQPDYTMMFTVYRPRREE